MNLSAILELHPQGADAPTLRAAISKAETLRAELVVKADQLDKERAAGLLTIDDKTLLRMDADARAARLAAERIAKLVPAIEAEWRATAGREVIEELRGSVQPVADAVTALRAWQEGEYPTLKKLLGRGLRLQAEAETARSSYLDRVQAAYHRPEVRDAGPLGVEVPELPDNLPSHSFPLWHLTAEDYE